LYNLGTGTNTDASDAFVPVSTMQGKNVQQIYASPYGTSMFVTQDQKVFTVGMSFYNNSGSVASYFLQNPVEMNMSNFPTNYKIKQLAVNGATTYILLEDGQVYMCGRTMYNSISRAIPEKDTRVTLAASKISSPAGNDYLLFLSNNYLYGVGSSLSIGLLSSESVIELQFPTEIPMPCRSGEYGTFPNCVTCVAGQYYNNVTRVCGACAKGYYSNSSTDFCSMCATDTYSATEGSTMCTPCATGYTSKPGASVCEKIVVPVPSPTSSPKVPTPVTPSTKNTTAQVNSSPINSGLSVTLLLVLILTVVASSLME